MFFCGFYKYSAVKISSIILILNNPKKVLRGLGDSLLMNLIINNLSYKHSNREILFQNVNFSLQKGQKVALVGNNGTGKSTLLQLLLGNLTPENGEIHRSESLYYVPQQHDVYEQMTVAQALGIDLKLNALHAILNGDVSPHFFDVLADDWDIENRTLAALSDWNLEHINLSDCMCNLSGGEKTKVFLSGIAIHNPEIVLLDEPSNHLDNKGRKKLYQFIEATSASVIAVSHDRTLLNLVPIICELTSCGIETFGGNYEFYKEQKQLKLSALQGDVAEKEKAIRLSRKLARETQERQEKHSTRGEKLSQKKGISRMGMNTLKDKSEKSTSKLKGVHTDKIETLKTELKGLQQKVPDMNRLKVNIENTQLHEGKILVTAKQVNTAYDTDFLWKESLDFQIRSGERIVIRGQNGSGKTSLVKLILGKLQPTEGEIVSADFSHLYLDQNYSLINENLTVFEQVHHFDALNLPECELKTLLHRFLFPAETWDKKCAVLSGGEKMKLLLCCLQVSNNMPDLLILDEPTNNLDIQTLEIITSFVKSYKGTLLVISHDEYFIQEIEINREIYLS